jgi:hypothetical protein
MTVAIAFNGGAYGTYLEWCLTTLTSKGPIIAPFTGCGNSHNFFGNHLVNFSGWQKYHHSDHRVDFFRFHPKTQKEESISNNLDEVCKSVDSMIYLYPDRNSILLCINNWFSKIYNDWWIFYFSKYIDPKKIYNNWPVDQNIKIEDVPRWIKREFLSFYLMPSWFDQVEWYHPNRWSHTNAQVITVNELLFDFTSTLQKIQRHCQLEFVRPITDLIPYHEQNLNLQLHIGQDQLCNTIINSIINNVEFDWDALPIASEAWLQWELRNQNWEIQCQGLDIMPTSSIQLKKLLYRPT